MLIKIDNNLAQEPLSFLATTHTSGGTSVYVRNAMSFSASHAIQLGKVGEQQTEIVMLGASTPSGTTLVPTTSLRFGHAVDTPVFQTKYDKVVVKRSTSGTTGTASALATVTITPDLTYTSYEDTSGAAGYGYKTQFYNSITTATSEESDWFVPGGPSFYSLAKMRSRVKNRLFSSGFIKDDTIIDEWINEWQETMNNAVTKIDKDYALGTVAIPFGTLGLGTITPTSLKSVQSVEVAQVGGTYERSSYMARNLITDEYPISTGTDTPIHFYEGDTVIGVRPVNSGGTIKVVYKSMYEPLNSDGDELPYPLRPYTTSCVEYALYCAYDVDGKDRQAESHYAKYLKGVTDFVSEMSPRDYSGPKTIEYVDELDC